MGDGWKMEAKMRQFLISIQKDVVKRILAQILRRKIKKYINELLNIHSMPLPMLPKMFILIRIDSICSHCC
jgi:hypothetical protein